MNHISSITIGNSISALAFASLDCIGEETDFSEALRKRSHEASESSEDPDGCFPMLSDACEG